MPKRFSYFHLRHKKKCSYAQIKLVSKPSFKLENNYKYCQFLVYLEKSLSWTVCPATFRLFIKLLFIFIWAQDWTRTWAGQYPTTCDTYPTICYTYPTICILSVILLVYVSYDTVSVSYDMQYISYNMWYITIHWFGL